MPKAQCKELLATCLSSLQKGFTSHLSEWASSKRTQTTNAGEDVEKRVHLCTIDGNVNCYSHYGIQYGDSSKKLKIELTHNPPIPLWVFIQRK